MEILLSIFSAALGLVIGSFLNVVVLRLAKKKPLSGRSQCTSCHKALQWYELIPVGSFLMQQGTCRSCRAKISWQYPLVEIVTGGVFLAIFLVFGVSWYTLFLFIIFSLLIAIAVYDIKHKIVPNVLVWPFVVLSVLPLFVYLDPQVIEFRQLVSSAPHSLWYFMRHVPELWHVLAGILIPLPFALIWLLSRGRLMGLGDAKIMIGMGWLLGLAGGISAVVYAFWIGALFGIGVIVIKKFGLFGVRKGSTMGIEVPFAPFLVLGTFVTLVLQWNIVALLF